MPCAQPCTLETQPGSVSSCHGCRSLTTAAGSHCIDPARLRRRFQAPGMLHQAHAGRAAPCPGAWCGGCQSPRSCQSSARPPWLWRLCVRLRPCRPPCCLGSLGLDLRAADTCFTVCDCCGSLLVQAGLDLGCTCGALQPSGTAMFAAARHMHLHGLLPDLSYKTRL